METNEAIVGRWTCRAFLNTPIPDETIRHILSLASWAPSGVNSQPWQVAVVKGQTKQAITEALIQARTDNRAPAADYAYYPDDWVTPYKERRIDCGKRLYAALGIGREDKDGQKIAWQNNYRFFGAAIGLFFFIDKRMNQGSWIDMGMYLQNLMLAATNHGLATCPQASLADYPDIIRTILHLEPGLALVCGMSLGYPDTHHPVNQYRLTRASVDEFCRWYD